MPYDTLKRSLSLLGTARFGTFWFASLLSSIGISRRGGPLQPAIQSNQQSRKTIVCIRQAVEPLNQTVAHTPTRPW